MGAKKHTLYSQCCQAELDTEYEDYCPKCRARVCEPIEEPDLEREQDIEFLN
jgi:hypothetical protein